MRQSEERRGEAASRSESEAFWLKSSGCCCVAQLSLSATKARRDGAEVEAA